MMRVDAHQHFWRLADRDGAWPPATLTAIYRDFLPADLEATLARHNIGKTVLVQSLPTEADTHFMLDLADRFSFIGAVVGWTDLKAADAPQRIAALARHSALRGLRPMLQELEDDWIADPALAPAVHAMQAHGLTLDALVLPRQLPALLTFAERFPELPIVIDHGAKPLIAQGEIDAWRAQMVRLAALPQVCCKLSGMVTEAGPAWNTGELQPYADTIVGAFGPARVMWGSDWPVLDLAADYGRWVAVSETLLAARSEAERQAIFGGTAAAFYRIQQTLLRATP